MKYRKLLGNFIFNVSYCQIFMILVLTITLIPIVNIYLPFLRKVMLVWIIIIIVKDIILDRDLFNNSISKLLILFSLMSIVTIFLNYSNNLSSNISFYVYTLSIMLGASLYVSRRSKEQTIVDIYNIGRSFVILTFLLSLLSIIIFMCNINIILYNESLGTYYSFYYRGRLPGLYFSATMGALIMLTSFMISCINLYINYFYRQNGKVKYVYASNIIVQGFLIYATDSRGSIVSLTTFSILFSILIICPLLYKSRYTKSVIRGICITVILFTGLNFAILIPNIRNVMPHIPYIGKNISELFNVEWNENEKIYLFGSTVCIEPILIDKNLTPSVESELIKKKENNGTNQIIDSKTVENKVEEEILIENEIKNDEKSAQNEINMERLEVLDVSNGRFDIWKAALKAYIKKPIFGLSVENTSKSVNEYLPQDERILNILSEKTKNCHNSYLQVLVNNGIVGFGIFILIAVIYAVTIIKYLLKSKHSISYLILLILAMLLTLCVTALFEWSIVLNVSATVPIFWIYLSFAYNYIKNKEYKKEERLI